MPIIQSMHACCDLFAPTKIGSVARKQQRRRWQAMRPVEKAACVVCVNAHETIGFSTLHSQKVVADAPGKWSLVDRVASEAICAVATGRLVADQDSSVR